MTSTSKRLKLYGQATATAICALLATPVSSQQLSVEEIVVTTQRRAESLQDVPVSITALTEGILAREGITSIDDLAAFVPGLDFFSLQGGTLGTPTIRGLSKGIPSNFDNNVAIFFDDLFLSNNAILDSGFHDLERVEVAFGPQSALFGRNSFAGAIRYVPKNPTNEFEMSGIATAGTDDRYDISARVSGPIIEDKLTFLASASYSSFEGTINNLFPGGEEKLGGWDEKQYFHAALQLDITEDWFVRGRYYRSETEIDSSPQYKISGQPGFNVLGLATNCGPMTDPAVGGLPIAFCGTIKGTNQVAVHPLSEGVENSSDLYSLVTELDTELATIKLQYGRIETDSEGFVDATFTLNQQSFVLPGSFQDLGIEVGNQFFQPFTGPVTDETFAAQITSNPDGALSSIGSIDVNWLIGGESFKTDRAQLFRRFDERGPGGSISRVLEFDRGGELDEYAFFGQIGFTFADKATLSFEGRRTVTDREDFTIIRLAVLGFIDLPRAFEPATFKEFTPRVTFDYQWSDDVMTYVNWSKGTKAGGFNSLIFPVPGEERYEAEVNKTWEFGVKARWLEGRLTTNLAVYSTNFSDLQTFTQSADPRNAVAIFQNVGAAKSEGFEFTGQAQVTDNFSLDLGVAYADPKFKQGTMDTSLAVYGPDAVNVGGNRLPRSSKLNLTATGEYSVPDVFGSFGAYGRLGVSHRSNQFAFQTNFAKLDAYSLVNGRIGIENENVDISLWADNLFNEKYAPTAVANLGTSEEAGVRTIEVYNGNTRMIGVTLKVNY